EPTGGTITGRTRLEVLECRNDPVAQPAEPVRGPCLVFGQIVAHCPIHRLRPVLSASLCLSPHARASNPFGPRPGYAMLVSEPTLSSPPPDPRESHHEKNRRLSCPHHAR